MYDLGLVWAVYDHLHGTGALLQFAELIAEAQARRDAETRWEVIQRPLAVTGYHEPGPGWEPFAVVGSDTSGLDVRFTLQ